MKLETIKGKLRARFSWQGKRLCLTFGLADTNRNRILAYKLIDKLETDILEGSFDGNLKRYIPKTKDRLENEKPNTKRTKKGYKTNRRDQRKPFTQQEIQAILNALSSNQFCPKCSVFSHSHYAPFVETILTLGCRNAELIGLQVKHVDFKSGLIEISSTLARSKPNQTNASSRVRKGTKTGNVRYLPMNNRLREVLLKQCLGKHRDELVFTSHTGKSIDDRMLKRRVLKRVYSGLGIPERDLYAARHTVATRLISEGYSLDKVAYFLGHKSIETTLRNYAHVINRLDTLPSIWD